MTCEHREIDLEAEYRPSLSVPEWPAIAARWEAAAAAHRHTTTGAQLDLPYGPHPRHRYDVFPAPRPRAAAVYLHGGYWQDGDRALYSWLAAPFTAAGITLAIPSYRLAPAATMPEILDDARAAVAAIAARLDRPPLVVGHSAGGHLAAALLATAATARAVAISGVFELEPLTHTSVNDALGLDGAGARAVSPLGWPPPPGGTTLLAAVGEHETTEFHRQSRALVDRWGQAGVDATYLSVTGANHFTVIDELGDAGSTLFARVAALAAEMAVGGAGRGDDGWQ